MGGNEDGGARLLAAMLADRTGGNKQRWENRKFHLNTRKLFVLLGFLGWWLFLEIFFERLWSLELAQNLTGHGSGQLLHLSRGVGLDNPPTSNVLWFCIYWGSMLETSECSKSLWAFCQLCSFSHTSLLSSPPESSTISSQRSSFPTSFWTSSYQHPPPPPCLSGVHPDFPVTAPGTFPTPDPTSWAGHALHQTAPPAPPAASESWHYPLAASQVSPPYAHMHDVYVHRHHAGAPRDPRYGSLLLPPVRARIPAPQGDKAEPAALASATSAWAGAFHGTVDIVPGFGFETGEAAWFGLVMF